MSGRAHPGLPRLLAGLDARPSSWVARAQHEQIHGPLPVVDTERLIEEVTLSGLRGRGGADFPTARKLRAVAERRRVAAVVVNGSETEPASGKDGLLLARLPHLVLDGAVLAARAVGAPQVIIKLSAGAARQDEAIAAAIAERAGGGIEFAVVSGGNGYVSGEESATVSMINGGPGLPTFTPPRPFERGVRRRPTLVQNPETLAQIALVGRFGHRWYRELGTEADPGSVLVTISGAVRAPGVYEMAFGTPVEDLLRAAGGCTEPLRALLVGGFFGTWIDVRETRDLRLARSELRAIGASLGSGVIVALGLSGCGLHESARLMSWLADESAGQCGPCRYGLAALAETFHAMVQVGARPRELVRRAEHLIEEIRGRGACHHPDGAVHLAESALRVFARELVTHAEEPCGARPAGIPLRRSGAVVA